MTRRQTHRTCDTPCTSHLTRVFCQLRRDLNMRRNSSVKAVLNASDNDKWWRRLLEVSLLDSEYTRVNTDIHFTQPPAILISALKILLRWLTASISSSSGNRRHIYEKCVIEVRVGSILASDFMREFWIASDIVAAVSDWFIHWECCYLIGVCRSSPPPHLILTKARNRKAAISQNGTFGMIVSDSAWQTRYWAKLVAHFHYSQQKLSKPQTHLMTANVVNISICKFRHCWLVQSDRTSAAYSNIKLHTFHLKICANSKNDSSLTTLSTNEQCDDFWTVVLL